MKDGLYYRHSGKAPAVGVLGMFVAGIVTAVGGAFLYIHLIELIPLIYFNFLIMIAYGALIGGAVALACKMGKVRNGLVCTLTGLIVACLALYVEWSYFLAIKLPEVQGESQGTMELFRHFLTNPGDSWDMMNAFNAVGLWTIKTSVVKGVFLWVVWALEAVGIVVAAVAVSRLYADEPYSETDNRWMDEENFDAHLAAVAEPKSFSAALERGDYTPLFGLGVSSAGESFSRVRLYTSPGDADAWLTVIGVKMVQKKKGKDPEEVKEDICKLVHMPAQKAKELAALLHSAAPAQEAAGAAKDTA